MQSENRNHPVIAQHMTPDARYIYKNFDNLSLDECGEYDETGILWNLTILNSWGSITIASLDPKDKHADVFYCLVAGDSVDPKVLITKIIDPTTFDHSEEALSTKHIKMFPNQAPGIKSLIKNDRAHASHSIR